MPPDPRLARLSLAVNYCRCKDVLGVGPPRRVRSLPPDPRRTRLSLAVKGYGNRRPIRGGTPSEGSDRAAGHAPDAAKLSGKGLEK